MKKIKGRKFSKRLAGAITLALLAAQAGSALAADGTVNSFAQISSDILAEV